MTTDAMEALDELESRAREAYVSGPGKTVSDLVATLRAALAPAADDEVGAIRKRLNDRKPSGPRGHVPPLTQSERDMATLLDRDARHVAEIAHLTAELSAERARRVEWQPIETAPKKGEVLLYWPRKDKGRNSVLYEMIRIGHADGTPSRPPTHWMPLPEPPATHKDTQDE